MSKNIILFNKNHIKIEKGISDKKNSSLSSCCIVSEKKSSQCTKNETYRRIKCKSPLGFYYTKTEHLHEKDDSFTIKDIKITLPSEVAYRITYVTECNGSRVSVDSRPWDIVCDGSLSEHYIKTLYDIINNIINEIKYYKIPIYYRFYTYDHSTVCKDVSYFRDEINNELFGNKKGIRFQTDSEKIISHGFDLKTSFRKRKNENK